MKKGKTTIKLHNQHLGTREFDLAHAERLVALEHKTKNVNWQPAAGSKHIIKNGQIIVESDKRDSEKTEEQS